VILEQHGYPPLLLDVESVDLLDHVVFVFQQNGRWGSIARSRDIGLQGRKPVFRNLRQLVWSYFEPYIDMTGRIKGYGLTSLYDLGNYDWRFSKKNMHKIEDHLRAIPHRKLRSSDRRYEYWHERYHTDPGNRWLRNLFAQLYGGGQADRFVAASVEREQELADS